MFQAPELGRSWGDGNSEFTIRIQNFLAPNFQRLEAGD
jgi:hypothetical protein